MAPLSASAPLPTVWPPQVRRLEVSFSEDFLGNWDSLNNNVLLHSVTAASAVAPTLAHLALHLPCDEYLTLGAWAGMLTQLRTASFRAHYIKASRSWAP